ncbi:Uncharacterised protein [Chryseobacterium taklimakanense]|uniref:Uncharacterized protein n=1 Tax=Chryseobacterium taklimakanense TaxID=536441 RepID=A0A239WR51_9FLAO|nr:Uncharacterised protein [Chryseobacterium taklimakanense]
MVLKSVFSVIIDVELYKKTSGQFSTFLTLFISGNVNFIGKYFYPKSNMKFTKVKFE